MNLRCARVDSSAPANHQEVGRARGAFKNFRRRRCVSGPVEMAPAASEGGCKSTRGFARLARISIAKGQERGFWRSSGF